MTALTSFVVRSPYLASVLDQRDDRILVGIAVSAMRLRTLLPDERLVSLNLFSGPAERVHLQNAHLLAEPMRHEPGVLSVMPNVRYSWLPTILSCWSISGTRLENMDTRERGSPRNRAHAHRELLAAGVILLRPIRARPFIDRAAMRPSDACSQTIASSRSKAACSSLMYGWLITLAVAAPIGYHHNLGVADAFVRYSIAVGSGELAGAATCTGQIVSFFPRPTISA